MTAPVLPTHCRIKLSDAGPRRIVDVGTAFPPHLHTWGYDPGTGAVPPGAVVAFRTHWFVKKNPKASPATAMALDNDHASTWILRRSKIASVFSEVPESQARLRSVVLAREVPKSGPPSTWEPLDDDWALLDVRARFPLDRDATPLCDDEVQRHTSMVGVPSGMPRWGPGRTPPFEIFRLGDAPQVVCVSARLLAALREATHGTVVAGEASVQGGLLPDSSDPDPLPVGEAQAHASGQAFWRLRGSFAIASGAVAASSQRTGGSSRRRSTSMRPSMGRLGRRPPNTNVLAELRGAALNHSEPQFFVPRRPSCP